MVAKKSLDNEAAKQWAPVRDIKKETWKHTKTTKQFNRADVPHEAIHSMASINLPCESTLRAASVAKIYPNPASAVGTATASLLLGLLPSPD